jgi:hypothetical protein
MKSHTTGSTLPWAISNISCSVVNSAMASISPRTAA